RQPQILRPDQLPERFVENLAPEHGFDHGQAPGDFRTGAYRNAGPQDVPFLDVENYRDPDDRDHQILATAELQEIAARIGSGGGYEQPRHQFVAPTNGLAIAREERHQGNLTLAIQRGQFHLRIERQQVGHAIGGGGSVADIADDRSGIL